jgi:ABC-type branched-subunit amino acid transport system ATPase component
MTESALDVENASISFGGIDALRNVTLRVDSGTRIGLIGPNGAGKTTLVNCIAGGLTPDSGEVTLFGESISRLSGPARARRGVGRTFQNLELFDSMSVLDNVMTALDRPLQRGGRTAARSRRDRARSAMSTFGVDRYAHVEAGSLPYGVRKLVELSRAFVREPRFLLLDEPVAGLSEPEVFLGVLVEGLDRLGCGVLLIEHDMPTVRELCERVYVLDSGAIIAEGTFAEVAADPRVIAAYLGADAV